MKNKFEALKAFQSWPREWQELCAEYWASDDEPKASVWTTSDKLATVGQLMQAGPTLPAIGDPFPLDGPKIGFGCIDQGEMKLEATRFRKSKPWSIAESEYLVKCTSENTGKLSCAVSKFLERYPRRSADAVRRRAWGMKCGELSPEIKY